MDADRCNRGFDHIRFKIFIEQFLRGHRQGADEVEHVFATCEFQFESQLQQAVAFADVEVQRQARHDGGVGGVENTLRLYP